MKRECYSSFDMKEGFKYDGLEIGRYDDISDSFTPEPLISSI